LVNEIWPFLRTLWRIRGGFRAEIKFNPEIDLREFGSQFGPGMFHGTYKFRISKEGLWNAAFQYQFEQVPNPYDDREDPERKSKPFYAQDYSRLKSNAAYRARRLAKPDWDLKEGRNDEEFFNLLDEEKILNNTIDFSFKYTYINSGQWKRDSNEIDVPDSMSVGSTGINVNLNPDTDDMAIDITEIE